MSFLGDAALEYARLGFPVLPLHTSTDGKCSCGDPKCRSPGKHPRTVHGVDDASIDLDVVREWWAKWSDAPIAVATGERSGFVVLDEDPRHGGMESIAELTAKHGELPEGPVVRTGGGGRHFYFQHPGGNFPNAIGFVPGLDIRGDQGYVLVPPSPHPSGGVYEWVRHVRDVKLPFLPGWLVKLLDDKRTGPGRTFPINETGQIPHGRHHDFIISTAASLAAKTPGISEEALTSGLRAFMSGALDDVDRHEKEIAEAARSALVKFGRPAPAGPPEQASPAPPPPAHSATPTAEPPPKPIPLGLFAEDEKTGELKPKRVEFVEWFRREEKFVVPVERGTFSTPGAFELLRYENGYYNGMARSFVRRRVEDAFRAADLASMDSFREEVVKSMGATSEFHRKRDTFNPPGTLCLENGFLDIAAGTVKPFEPFDPNLVFTWKMPVSYDTTATCPRFDQFLVEIMPDPAKRELLVDLLGYCLWRKNPFQLFFMLVGDGGNGKTVYLNVIQELLGKDAVATASLHDLNSDHWSAAELDGKLVNLCDDLPYDQRLRASGVLKTLTGEGTRQVQRKYGHPFPLSFQGKLISAANRTPETEDDTYAFWRRLVVIEFEEVFPEDDPRRDPHLMDKLRMELSGILNRALEGLKRVQSRDRFDPKGCFADSKENYRNRADPIRAELMEGFKTDPTGWVSNRALYEHHVRRAQSEGRDPMGDKAFGMRVKRIFPLSQPERRNVAGNPVWGRRGISEKGPSPVLDQSALKEELARRQQVVLDAENGSKSAETISRQETGSASPVLAGVDLPGGKTHDTTLESVGAGPARTGDEGAFLPPESAFSPAPSESCSGQSETTPPLAPAPPPSPPVEPAIARSMTGGIPGTGDEPRETPPPTNRKVHSNCTLCKTIEHHVCYACPACRWFEAHGEDTDPGG